MERYLEQMVEPLHLIERIMDLDQFAYLTDQVISEARVLGIASDADRLLHRRLPSCTVQVIDPESTSMQKSNGPTRVYLTRTVRGVQPELFDHHRICFLVDGQLVSAQVSLSRAGYFPDPPRQLRYELSVDK